MAVIRRVLLLRGINVGGSGRLAMAALRATLEKAGAREVRTLIQSGNAVFGHPEPDADRLRRAISDAVAAEHGFRPEAVVLTPEALAATLEADPFPDAEPKRVHLWLSAAPPTPQAARLDALASPSERWAEAGGALWLSAPDGIGRSKLAAGMERALGVPATARNLDVLRRLLAAATPEAAR